MEYVTAFNNYIVEEPSGDIRGFVELSDARSYISSMYLNRILYSERGKYSVFDMTQERDMEDYGLIAGVNQGECKIFDLDDFLEKIRNSSIFQDEKDELISKLLEEEIKLNVIDYTIDDILIDVEEKWTV